MTFKEFHGLAKLNGIDIFVIYPSMYAIFGQFRRLDLVLQISITKTKKRQGCFTYRSAGYDACSARHTRRTESPRGLPVSTWSSRSSVTRRNSRPVSLSRQSSPTG